MRQRSEEPSKAFPKVSWKVPNTWLKSQRLTGALIYSLLVFWERLPQYLKRSQYLPDILRFLRYVWKCFTSQQPSASVRLVGARCQRDLGHSKAEGDYPDGFKDSESWPSWRRSLGFCFPKKTHKRFVSSIGFLRVLKGFLGILSILWLVPGHA